MLSNWLSAAKFSNCSNSLNFEAKINFNTNKPNVPKWRKTCTGLKFDLPHFYGPQSHKNSGDNLWGPCRSIGRYNGAPMYDKVGGRGKIMRQIDGKWIVVKGFGVRSADAISADTAPCPTDINHWSYHTFIGRARITINCSQKSKLTILRSKQVCLTLG